MTRLAILVPLLIVISDAAVPAQTRQCVTLRIETPVDDPDEGIFEISTAEGRATAGVQLAQGDEYRDFYLDIVVRDPDSGLVLVSIRNDRNSDRVVDEFELRADGGAIQAATTPPFTLSVLRIFERTSFSCSL